MQTRPKSLLLPSTKLLSPLLRCASLIPVLQQSTSGLTRSGVVAAASRQLWHTSEKACTGQAGAAQHIQVDQAMKKTSIGSRHCWWEERAAKTRPIQTVLRTALAHLKVAAQAVGFLRLIPNQRPQH